MYLRIGVFLLLGLVAFSCGEHEVSVTPKPRTYPKVEYPVKRYQVFDRDQCNFVFEFPTYAQVVRDSSGLTEAERKSSCWFDLYFPAFDGRLHCSYYRIGQNKSFEELKTDAFEMADYHNKRANYIEELKINRFDADVDGFVFSIEGPAATPFQFYLTDNETHFFRASLYFDTEVRPDSIAPIYKFVREDMMKIIETFEWTQ